MLNRIHRAWVRFSPARSRRNRRHSHLEIACQISVLETRVLLTAAPVVTDFGPTVTYLGDFQPVSISPTVEVSDADGNFAGGNLTVQLTNGKNSDILTIIPGNGVTVSGSEIQVDGNTVGFVSIGFSTTPLNVAFPNAVSAEQVQRVFRQVGFVNNKANSPFTPRNVTATLTDGSDLSSEPVSKTIAISDVPILANDYPNAFYRGGSAPVNIGSSIFLRNSGNDEASSRLIVEVRNAEGGDQVGLWSDASISVNNGALMFAGVNIGTVIHSQSGSRMEVLFNANADFEAARAVIQRVTYFSNRSGPSLGVRHVDVQFIDGGGLASNVATKNVKILNDLVLTDPGSTSTYDINTPPVNVALGTDVEGSAKYLSNSLLRVNLTNMKPGDVLSIRESSRITVSGADILFDGDVVGSIVSPSPANLFQIRFVDGVSRSAVRTVIRHVAFSTTSLSTKTRVVYFNFVDETGSNSSFISVPVEINTAPAIIELEPSVTYSAGDDPVRIGTGGKILEPGGQFDGSQLIVDITNRQAGDLLLLQESGPVTFDGNIISVDGLVIATFTGGDGAPLTIDFNQDAVRSSIQKVLRRVTYWNDAETPATVTRQISFQYIDGTLAASPPVLQELIYQA